jgi:hypothetical protein
VLLLDIVPDKHPPLWVPTRSLFESLMYLDPETKKPRGYFVVSKAKGQVNQCAAENRVCITTGKDK